MPTLDEVYRKFGKVSEAAQLLETELGTMLLSVQATEHDLFASDKGELATEILEKINKSTFGELIRKLAKAARFSGDSELLLANALAERNRLFHSFYRKHNFRRNSDEGRAKMLEDLQRKHKVIIAAYTAVMRLSGIDLDNANVPMPTTHVKIQRCGPPSGPSSRNCGDVEATMARLGSVGKLVAGAREVEQNNGRALWPTNTIRQAS
jgi:hypothetical protein